MSALTFAASASLILVLPAAGAQAGTHSLSSPQRSANAAPAALRRQGSPLTPRLRELSRSSFQAKRAPAQAKQLGLATSGPGSLIRRSDGRILVDIRLANTRRGTLRQLRDIGASLTYVDRSLRVVTAAVQPSRLTALAAVQPQVLSVNEDLQPMTQAACPTGPFVSEGDTMLNAATGRSNHQVDGSGVMVGVLSDSYNALGGASADVTNGELPGATNPCGKPDPVTVQADYAGSGVADEGRAMAQIVHDLAPGARLRFATADNGEYDFANQIRDLAAAGASTIVDDITYFDEPMYQDGVVGSAVEDVSAQGVSYFSSAGNENTIIGGHDVGSYEAPAYRPTTCPASVITADPGVLDCHNFNPDVNGSPDNTYGFTLNGNLAYVLGWNEPQFGITTDLDMCLLSHTAGTVYWCSNENNLQTQRAFEIIQGSGGCSCDIVVARHAGAGTPRFKLVSFRSALLSVEHSTSSGGDVVGPTIFGHNASRSGATVAAIPYNNANTLESYSSRGPATYCWGPVNGTTPAAALPSCQPAGVDMSATDGVQTSFFYSKDSQGVFRFYGTSAAAPHAAAIAALIHQEHPCLDSGQVMKAMTSTADQFGTFGSDAEGAGRLNADAALTAANAESCDHTAPHVTVTFSPSASGWFTTSPATGQVTVDDASNVASVDCTGATVTDLTGTGTTTASATLTVSSEGISNVSCTATDGSGNANSGADPTSANTATVQVDTRQPVAGPTATPAPNNQGWNSSDVQVSWNWTDPAGGSAIDSTSCTTSSTSAGEGASLALSATCVDHAGNSSTSTYQVNVDKTAPTLDPVVTPNPVIRGHAATVTSGASDSLSGLASQSCGDLDTTTTGSKTVTCTATDNAGNTTTTSLPYQVVLPTVTIAPVTLPNGTGGVAYATQHLAAVGGSAPYTYEVTAGHLPHGLSLTSDGVLSGMPSEYGPAWFTVTVTDADGDTGSQAYSMTVASPTIVMPTSLPGATYAAAYDESVAAAQGTAPYSYTVTAGALAPGLDLDQHSGEVSGTPTAAGDYAFTVTATDSGTGDPAVGSQAYTLHVARAVPMLEFTAPTTGGVVGQSAAIGFTTSAPPTVGVSVLSATPATCAAGPETGTTVTYLHPGSCELSLESGTEDPNYAPASASESVTISQAATALSLTVQPHHLVATASVVAPGAGTPTGTVTFEVDGKPVGHADLTQATASLHYTVSHGKARNVTAIYSGDVDFTGSSASTSRHDPTITAHVTSARPKSGFGWFRSPVTVSFTCTTNGAPLVSPCPSPVTVTRNGAAMSVTRTVVATDGGTDTVAVRGLNLDQKRPRVRVKGVADGAVYGGRAPQATCVATDGLSGVASCTIHRHTRGTLTRFRATAIDRAGNRAAVAGSYRIPHIYLPGVRFSHHAWQVRVGHSYTLVVTHSMTRPQYVDAAPYPHRPHGPDTELKRAGHRQWEVTVTITPDMGHDRLWNLGVKIGSRLHVLLAHTR